jgi:hypothetical protein
VFVFSLFLLFLLCGNITHTSFFFTKHLQNEFKNAHSRVHNAKDQKSIICNAKMPPMQPKE